MDWDQWVFFPNVSPQRISVPQRRSIARSPLPAVPPTAAAAGLRNLRATLAAARRLQRVLMAAVRPLQIGDSELLLLDLVHESSPEGIDQRHLAEELVLSPALVSQLVEQLRRRNWMSCARDAGDRRRQVWKLTAEGSAALAQADELLRTSGLARSTSDDATDVSRRGDAA
jgi:DNA-binding MarR family transcriptional regulator